MPADTDNLSDSEERVEKLSRVCEAQRQCFEKRVKVLERRHVLGPGVAPAALWGL